MIKLRSNIIISLLILNFTCFGQGNIDKILTNASLIVHLDDNMLIEISELDDDSLIEWYKPEVLNNNRLLSTTFIRLNSRCLECTCSYILAYSELETQFYKILGFRQNELKKFCNTVLPRELDSIDKPSKLIKEIEVESINIEDLFKIYYNNCELGLRDTSSCFRKSIINEY